MKWLRFPDTDVETIVSMHGCDITLHRPATVISIVCHGKELKKASCYGYCSLSALTTPAKNEQRLLFISHGRNHLSSYQHPP